ncbi:hypothetical protein [Streptomyces antibioticus]|uniref:hypothetical protein n=1 Tax=Streptomyces antibioticus TaxID=1890 RepID=UPI0033DBE511
MSTEEEHEGADLFGDLIQGLEEELNTQLLQKKATYAIASARITGAVFTEAVASGVPAALAQEMATDTWMNVMGIPLPVIDLSDVQAGSE